MNTKRLVKWGKKIRHWPVIFSGKKEYIFLVSHMRSRSTLLSHILGSHEDISGYAEMSQSYHGVMDFVNLRYEVWDSNSQTLPGRFVLDKILHNRYDIAGSGLSSHSVKVCYLLRRPDDAIRSITKLAQLHSGARIWEKPDQAALYYEERVARMVEYVRQGTEQSFFIESDDLINNTEPLLTAFSDWLSLSDPLSSSYSLFERSGKPGFGDPSKIIMTGKVVVTKQSNDALDLSAELLERVNESYLGAREIFQKQCVHLKAGGRTG